MVEQVIWFIFLGLVGGVAYVIMHSDDWDDLTRFGAFKRVVIGGIVGGIYFILYSEHDFPNTVMAFVSGYMGTDFIERLVKKGGKEI